MSTTFSSNTAALQRCGVCRSFHGVVVKLRVDGVVDFDKACGRFESQRGGFLQIPRIVRRFGRTIGRVLE